MSLVGFHTFDPDRADKLEDVSRFRFCSREELVGHLHCTRESIVADFGSGTGFYTDEIAPFVGRLYAVDVQSAMHDHYREKGVPSNVSLVTSEIESVPFTDGELDAVFSTMTFHEFASPAALEELARILTDGGRVVIVDWTAAGSGDDGPPLDERYDLDTAIEQFEDAEFEVEFAQERPETFVIVATL